MLARSNSTADDRLRRAKSTSSVHSTSSGHHRSAQLIDPFIAQRDAEVAAIEAYKRAQQYEQQTYRPPPPRLQRRQSQRTGRSEGSHFEDSRQGFRRSGSNKSNTSNRDRPARNPPRRDVDKSIVRPIQEERVITRPRSIIEPSMALDTRQTPRHDVTPINSSVKQVRKVQSMYGNGSPLSRGIPMVKQRMSTTYLQTPQRPTGDAYGSNLERLSDFRNPTDVTVQSYQSPRPTIREMQTDEDILAIARDKCLQDFHQKKVRQRKSFILAPFQKLRTKTQHLDSDVSYDSSLPPFNYADENGIAPVPVSTGILPNPVASVGIDPKHIPKTRGFSGSFKDTIKKAFRRTSRAPSGLPVQHVEAKNPHFTVNGSDAVIYDSTADMTEPAAPSSSTPKPRVQLGSARLPSEQSTATGAENDTLRSRATSWTNSTITGTVNSSRTVCNADDNMASVGENGGLQRSNTGSTLRRTSSFFGRPVRSLLRRQSRADMARNSEDSERLYSAIQERIKATEKASMNGSPSITVVMSDDITPRPTSALDALPSRRQANSSATSSSRWAQQTIRSVTPDPYAYKLTIPSPVVENTLSPDVAQPRADTRHRTAGPANNTGHFHDFDDDFDDVDSPERTPTGLQQPRNRLQRRLATKVSAPSHEQIARRVELSKNRWQDTLADQSPALPHSTRCSVMDENPYELRPITRSIPPRISQETVGDAIDHSRMFAPAQPSRNPPPRPDRQDVLSPSIYSRATNDSPRPDTPIEEGGLSVSIIGREVRRYSLSPPKPTRLASNAVRTSRDWQAWMKKEMGGLTDSPGPEDLTLMEIYDARLRDATPPTPTITPDTDILMPCKDVMTDVNRPSQPRNSSSRSPAVPVASGDGDSGRPQLSSRKSSFMNERFPMIETGRTISDKSIKTLRKLSSAYGDRLSSVEPRSSASYKVASSAKGILHTDVSRPASMLDRHHPMSRPVSILPDSRARSKTSLGVYEMKISSPKVSDIATDWTPSLTSPEAASTAASAATPNRPKSAFELRANYKSAATGTTKPVNIRRKPITSTLLEDHTIRKISAGPYGSPQPSKATDDENKENSPPAENAALPTLSSSEWLAAGTVKKIASRDALKSSSQRPASRARESPARKISLYPSPNLMHGKGSPGQRYATEWLAERKKREESPAFM